MTHSIFFSWQSDTPGPVGRTMIEKCLERAIGTLRADADIEVADRDIAIDSDTTGVPGSPPIAETIFGKIDSAKAFLSDLTFVANRSGGGGVPNPNVCIEHGWALKSLTWRAVISVMNTAMGHPDEHPLPFDLRHARRPILYDCPPDAGAEKRQQARDLLTKQLVMALKAIFGDQAAQAAQPPAPAEPHPHDVELLERVHHQLSVGLRRFLHQHDFGAPFVFAVLAPVHEMNEDWVGAAFEFHDEPLQQSFTELRRASEAFGALILERIYPLSGRSSMGGPKTNLDERQGLQPATLQVIREMNAKATELSAAIDSFDRVSRDRVRVATGIHAPAPQSAADPRENLAKTALEELSADAVRGGVPEIVTLPRLTLRLVPFAATEGRRLDAHRVADAQTLFPPSLNERVKTDSDGRQWWSYDIPRRREQGMNPETQWRMRLGRPGYFEFQLNIGSRIDDDPEILIDGRQLEAWIVRHVERMAAIASRLDLVGPALVSVSFEGIADVELTRSRPGGRRIQRPELVLPVAKLGDLGQPVAPVLHEQLDILWQTAGWADGSPSFGSGEWAGYTDRRLYEVD